MSHPQKAFCSKCLSSYNKLLTIIFLFCTLSLIFSCHVPNYTPEQKNSFPRTLKKIVVVGFKPAISGKERASLFQCPLCGATFMAKPVTCDVAEEMTVSLFNCLEKDQKYALIPPGQAKGIYSTIISQNLTIGIKDMLQKIGESFSSDAVLFGYIYRWKERIGKEYGIESPASVAFDLHLVSTGTGSILWKKTFKKTQQSLSENLLDLATFIKSKGKWLTAKELATIGLESMMKCIYDYNTH
jgi:hypothetical protein